MLSILKEEIVDLKQYMKERAVDVEGVNKMLESDDRVLGRLERLAGGVVVGVDDGQDAKEILERVTALVKKYELPLIFIWYYQLTPVEQAISSLSQCPQSSARPNLRGIRWLYSWQL